MSKAQEIVTSVKVREDSDVGIFLNYLFPIINGSGTKMRAERMPGKPSSISVKYDSGVYRLDVTKVK